MEEIPLKDKNGNCIPQNPLGLCGCFFNSDPYAQPFLPLHLHTPKEGNTTKVTSISYVTKAAPSLSLLLLCNCSIKNYNELTLLISLSSTNPLHAF
jgi:hypothetical protein